MTPDAEVLRRHRSGRPMRHEILLLLLSAVTFLLAYFDLTPYAPSNMIGLGAGLLIGAIISYAFRLSRR